MSPYIWYLLGGWLLLINLVGIVVTAWDKVAARHARRRVAERTLLLLAALGGAVTMYITMHLIRHKTRKPKFMVGIPAIVVAELSAAGGLWWLFIHI